MSRILQDYYTMFETTDNILYIVDTDKMYILTSSRISRIITNYIVHSFFLQTVRVARTTIGINTKKTK
jgi:hypothetical protein